MSMNAFEFARKYDKNYTTVLNWIKKGYLGELNKDKAGRYVIPDDMPVPFKADGKVNQDTTLVHHFLEASNCENSISSTMYPKVRTERFNRLLNETVDKGLVNKSEPFPGVIRLESTELGRGILSAEPKEQNKMIEAILKGLPTAVNLIAAAAPILQQYIAKAG